MKKTVLVAILVSLWGSVLGQTVTGSQPTSQTNGDAQKTPDVWLAPPPVQPSFSSSNQPPAPATDAQQDDSNSNQPSAASPTTSPSVTPPVATPPAQTPPAPVVDSTSASPKDSSSATATQQQLVMKLQELLQKAQENLNNSRYQDAITTCESILLLDPENTQAKQIRDNAKQSLQSTARKQELLQKGQKEFESGHYQNAMATADAILVVDPQNAQAKQLHDDSALNLEKEKIVASETKKQSDKLQPLLQKAQDSFNKSQYQDAITTAESILLLDPENAQAKQIRDNAQQAQKSIAKSQELLQKGQKELQNGQYQSAIATADAILVFDPKNSQAKQLHDSALSLEKKKSAAVETKEKPSTPTPNQAPLNTDTAVPRVLSITTIDGNWQGSYQCGPYNSGESRSFSAYVAMRVQSGQATLIRETPGEQGLREVLTGTVTPDLVLRLTGTGRRTGFSSDNWNTDFTGRFSQVGNQDKFDADGVLSFYPRRGNKVSRDCHLALTR